MTGAVAMAGVLTVATARFTCESKAGCKRAQAGQLAHTPLPLHTSLIVSLPRAAPAPAPLPDCPAQMPARQLPPPHL